MASKKFVPLLLFSSALLTGQQSGPTLSGRVKPRLVKAMAAGSAFVNGSAADGSPAIAPGSLAAAFGTGLAAQTANGTAPFPTSLGGISVQVVDSGGAAATAQLLYVSPTQINYVVPASAAMGAATVNIINGTGNVPNGTAQIQAAAPTLFTANGNGQGVVAATAYRTSIPISLSFPVQVYRCPSGAGSCVSVPIDPGLDQPVFITLYATGLKSLSGKPEGVSVVINGQTFPTRVIAASDPAGPLAGVDEVTFGLSLSLRGSGEVSIALSVNGQMSNSGLINIQ